MSDRTTLFDIAQIVEFSVEYTGLDLQIVNAYLEAGWVLLTTYPVGEASEGQTLRYSLGWPRTKGDPVHYGRG